MLRYYQILGLPYGATVTQVKAAYRKLALQYHPDRNQGNLQAEEHFKQIVEAYQALTAPGATFTYEHFNGPASSSTEPETPRSRDPYFRNKKAQPRKPPEPVVFSKSVKRMGIAFMVVLVVLVVSIPMSLQVYASIHNYEEGKALYNNKQWIPAFKRLEWAYRTLGIRNLETATLITKLMTENLKFYNQALPHISRGLRYAENASDSAFFLFKKGICMKNTSDFDKAEEAFLDALAKKPQWDSAYYYLGEINTFGKLNYETGANYFTQALEINPNYADCFMGRGYCHYQRKNFDIAVLDFNSFLKYSSVDRGTGFYLRGMALLESHHPELACQDFVEAEKLGAKGGRDAFIKNCQ